MLLWKRQFSVDSPHPPEEVERRLQRFLPRFEVPGTHMFLIKRYYFGVDHGSSFSFYGPKTPRRAPTIKVHVTIESSGSGSHILLTVLPFGAMFNALIMLAFAGLLGILAFIKAPMFGMVSGLVGGTAVLFYLFMTATSVPRQTMLFLAFFKQVVDAGVSSDE